MNSCTALDNALQKLDERKYLTRFVVDESHCISTWSTFRRDYGKLSKVRENFCSVPIMALIASATPRMQAEIATKLDLTNTEWFINSFNRKNIFYNVIAKSSSMKKSINDFLKDKRFEQYQAIVYCLSTHDCDETLQYSIDKGTTSTTYHRGLTQKAQNLTITKNGKRRIAK